MTDTTRFPLSPLLSSYLPLFTIDTDGGRISMSMCGRRGAYLVKTFTTLLLVAMGLFGLDDSRIILFYVFFAAIWQGELDAPVFNEVDEMDITRGLAAIATILLVCVTLVPVL